MLMKIWEAKKIKVADLPAAERPDPEDAAEETTRFGVGVELTAEPCEEPGAGVGAGSEPLIPELEAVETLLLVLVLHMLLLGATEPDSDPVSPVSMPESSSWSWSVTMGVDSASFSSCAGGAAASSVAAGGRESALLVELGEDILNL